jgi:hypothetical protein
VAQWYGASLEYTVSLLEKEKLYEGRENLNTTEKAGFLTDIPVRFRALACARIEQI